MSKKTFKGAHKFVVSLATISAFSMAPNVLAAEAPSNEDLYKMILELQGEQARLKEEAKAAKAEAAAAKQELASTKKELLSSKASPQKVAVGSALRIPDKKRGAYAGVAVVHKRPEHDRLTYAQVTHDFDGLTSKGVDVDTDYDTGGRLNLGYYFDEGLEGFFQYTSLDTSAKSSIGDPGGDLELNPKLVPEEELNFDQDAELDFASASYDIDYDVIDAGFAQHISIGSQFDLRVGAGLRYSSIDDELSALYIDSSESIQVSQINDFTGVGPRLTVDLNWNIPNSKFSVTTMFGTSLLYGENEFSYFSMDDDGDAVSFDNDERRQLTVTEASIGLKYSDKLDDLLYTISLAYELETWNDALSTLTYVDGTTDQLFIREDTDLVLHGISLDAKVQW